MPSRVACYALLTLCLLLIIWLRSRRVVLTPPRLAHHASSTSADALGPLPFEVEWHVPVGCGFSGFFVEVALGFVPPLAGSGSLRLLCGRCDEDFLAGQLTAKEAGAIRSTWVDEAARSPKQTRDAVVIEHGEPCGMRRWRAAERPLWVISRTMTEGDLAPQQADCLKGADEARGAVINPCSRSLETARRPLCSRCGCRRSGTPSASPRQASRPRCCESSPSRSTPRPSHPRRCPKPPPPPPLVLVLLLPPPPPGRLSSFPISSGSSARGAA